MYYEGTIEVPIDRQHLVTAVLRDWPIEDVEDDFDFMKVLADAGLGTVSVIVPEAGEYTVSANEVAVDAGLDQTLTELAPYALAEITCRGEDGSRWKWILDGGRFHQIDGEIVFPNLEKIALGALPDLPAAPGNTPNTDSSKNED